LAGHPAHYLLGLRLTITLRVQPFASIPSNQASLSQLRDRDG